MRLGKRVFVTSFSIFYILANVLSSYTTAYAASIPVVYSYSAVEVLELIFLSLGVTWQTAELDLGDETVADALVYEVESFFQTWANMNGLDDPAQLRSDLDACVQAGRDGIITISDELWSALKSWAGHLWENGISSSSTLTVADTMALLDMSFYSDSEIMRFRNAISSIYSSGYQNCIVQRVSDSGSILYDLYYLQKGGNLSWELYLSSGTSGSVTLRLEDGVKMFYHSTPLKNFTNESKASLGTVYSPNVASLVQTPKNISWSASGIYEGGNVSIICENMMLNSASDVVWPEESLAYDLCILPDVDMETMLNSGAYDVVTSGRTWDGTDVAGDVVITFPEDLAADVPFADWYDDVVAGDIPYVDALTGTGVIAVDTTKDEVLTGSGTIADAIIDSTIADSPTIEDTKEEVGENGEVIPNNVPMTFDLSKLFPFCIPFDIIDFLAVLSAEPQAPCIRWPIQYPTLSGVETYELVIDLSQFDDIAALLRTMETLVFIVGLAGITRNHMIRG